MKKKTIVIILIALLILSIVSSVILRYYQTKEDSNTRMNEKVRSEIETLFKAPESKIVFYPADKKITLERGHSGEGFIFSIKNKNLEMSTFNYKIYVDPNYDLTRQCGQLTIKEAESWLMMKEGNIVIPGNSSNTNNPELILFTLPDNAPFCTVIYTLEIWNKGDLYYSSKFYMTVVPKPTTSDKVNNFIAETKWNLGDIYNKMNIFDKISILLFVVIMVIIFYPKKKEN